MTGDSKNCKQAAFLVEDLEFFKRDGGGGGRRGDGRGGEGREGLMKVHFLTVN